MNTTNSLTASSPLTKSELMELLKEQITLLESSEEQTNCRYIFKLEEVRLQPLTNNQDQAQLISSDIDGIKLLLSNGNVDLAHEELKSLADAIKDIDPELSEVLSRGSFATAEVSVIPDNWDGLIEITHPESDSSAGYRINYILSLPAQVETDTEEEVAMEA